jgi:hypothetical protein
MIISFLAILIITTGGCALTYLVESEEPLFWRLAAGNVIGSAIAGTLAFALATVFGLTPLIVIGSFAVLLCSLFVLRGERLRRFKHDWAKAKGKLEGASFAKFLRFAYYAGFAALFLVFFGRVMIENEQGIFTGGSQNLGDLPFHLGAIFGFTDGANFPPQNPSFANARFSYPFIADFLTACFVKLGAGVRESMHLQNAAWAVSLLAILERFVLKLTGDTLAARIAPVLLFFSGGLGFLWALSDLSASGKGLFDFLWHLPKDYTISDQFRWGNSLVTLFITQRSLLFGMPLAIAVLGYLYSLFAAEQTDDAAPDDRTSALLGVGALAGVLPLIHLHSLVVLFVVGVFLLIIRWDHWRTWLLFGAGVSVTAIPILLWSLSGSATHANEFIALHFGWDSRDANFIWFWFTNTGPLIPFIAAGVYLVLSTRTTHVESASSEAKPKKRSKVHRTDPAFPLHSSSLGFFYVPFVVLFVVSNVAKFAPWEWDNIKILIYWFVASLPFVGFAISWLWHRDVVAKAAAGVCIFMLVASGALDVWRTLSAQINYRVFDAEAVALSQRLKSAVPPDALFLNAPTYNSAVVLTGRRSYIRYPGHLSSHGIDYKQRESDVRTMYAGGAAAEGLLAEHGIEYVLISPEEKRSTGANEEFFRKYPIIAEAGQYRVYKIK